MMAMGQLFAIEDVIFAHRFRAWSSADDPAALVRAAQGGDRAAFGALHDRYAGMVHGLLLAKVPPPEARDLVQDIFLIALERLGTLRDESAFGPWLAQIARSRAVDFYRQRRETAELPELPHPAGPDAEAALVLAAIRSLPEAYAETLILRLVEGMTGPEIAERTGLTPGSVRVNLHRGMKLLREKLGYDDE
jgi:RNA polymerase sigma-70 factor (ECF subfamily)